MRQPGCLTSALQVPSPPRQFASQIEAPQCQTATRRIFKVIVLATTVEDPVASDREGGPRRAMRRLAGRSCLVAPIAGATSIRLRMVLHVALIFAYLIFSGRTRAVELSSCATAFLSAYNYHQRATPPPPGSLLCLHTS
jgi:hypothetical protein